jgi:hypothetical protein
LQPGLPSNKWHRLLERHFVPALEAPVDVARR